MCFKKPSMPAVEQVDPEAQQREIYAKAAARAARDQTALRQRRSRSALAAGQGTALGMYGGGNRSLGGGQ